MQIQALSPEQIARIHAASLTILERHGVHVPHVDVLARFADAGARVDWATQQVRISADLVAHSLATAGKQFTLYGRDLTRRAAFGLGQRNYNSIAGEALWVERLGGERRYATLADVVTAARLGDALEGINLVGAMSDPHDLPVASRTVRVMATMLKHTTKPIQLWYHDRASARLMNEIMIALRGSELAAAQYPLTYPFLEPISPLRFPFDGIDLLYETARLNLPVPIGPMAQMGLSAPCTLAATMAQENAEILAGVCITQLIRPGMPVCYGGICHAFDMRTTQMIFAGPEQALFGVAMTQMGKHYGLPVYINVGLTDAKRPDAQAGLEIGITLMLGAAAGADIFGHLGISGVDQGASPEMLLLQHEAVRYVESVLRDVVVDDETLALDELAGALADGTFVAREHTARHFRRALWMPQLLDREYYDAWLERGATSLEERAHRRLEHLLKSHQPEPLAPELEHALDEIVAAADRELLPGSDLD